MLNNIDFQIKDNNIIYISQFGSFGTSEWIKNVSDIDIGVILNSLNNIDFSLEDFLISKFQKTYNYDNINITFVELNLDDKLTRNIICGKTLYSTFDEKDWKYKCLYKEKTVNKQRTYYEYIKLQKIKNEVSNLW